MLHGVLGISSSWNFFDQEKQNIENFLMRNLYSSYIIDKENKTFLEKKFTAKENTNINHNNRSVSYYKLPYIGFYSNSPQKKNKKNNWIMQNILQKCQCWNCFFTIQIAGPIFFKRLFASCSDVLCCVEICLCRIHCGNKPPFTNKDQGAFANWYKISHSPTPKWES